MSPAVRPDLRAYLGRRVAVVVDRPLGSRHPRHADLRYPVNYGFLPGTIAGDGAPLDAYVLGVAEPVCAATGVVIAVVERADDVGDKLVVAPAGQRFTAEQLAAALASRERFFAGRVVTASGGVG